MDLFLNGEVDEVFLVYTNFYSMGRQTVEMMKLLPLELESEHEHVVPNQARTVPAAYIYEPADVRSWMKSSRVLQPCRFTRRYLNRRPVNMPRAW